MRIEDIIKSQRAEMDVEQPPSDMWNNIRNDWKKPDKQPSVSRWWKVAAVIFISTSITLLIYTLALRTEVERLATLGDISEEYQEIENRYIAEIDELESGIQIDNVSIDSDYGWIKEEMNTLEEINELYRRDIGKAVDQTQLVNALIDYYEKKIKLLKKLELEINRTKKFNNNEKDDTDNINI